MTAQIMLAATPDPTFTTRAELEAWAEAELDKVQAGEWCKQRSIMARIRRVTLAHVHLKEVMTSPPHPKETSGE